MRAVSDFLDRVATRALGGESMLSPRLPSLFEPAGRSGAAVAEESLQVQATPVQRVPGPSQPDTRQTEGGATAQPSSATPVLRPPRETATQAEPGERVVIVDDARTFVAHNALHQSIAERESPSAAMHSTPMAAGELQLVRETHVLREPVTAIPAHEAPLGVLLPPGQPVFATRHEAQARHPSFASRSSTGRSAEAPSASHEPVVHVSIGRLEVRAAPTGVVAPRRQATPRSSALDDYLRQRDGAKP